MADWNDPKVVVLITPVALNENTGWCSMVQKFCEQGRLKRYYIRFGWSQGRYIQAVIRSAPPQTQFKVVAKSEGRYFLVRVTYVERTATPDPTPRNAA